jgi:hypothetical protein
MPSTDPEQLRAENIELRRRVEVAEAALDELRAGALARRAEIRRMAEALPAEMSRNALLRAALLDARDHPDKLGVVKRSLRKLGRAPAKAYRRATGRD